MVNRSNHIHLKQFLERNKRQNFKRFFQKIKKILTEFSKKVKKKSFTFIYIYANDFTTTAATTKRFKHYLKRLHFFHQLFLNKSKMIIFLLFIKNK